MADTGRGVDPPSPGNFLYGVRSIDSLNDGRYERRRTLITGNVIEITSNQYLWCLEWYNAPTSVPETTDNNGNCVRKFKREQLV